MDNKRVMSTYLLQSLIPFNTAKTVPECYLNEQIVMTHRLRKGERVI